MLLLIVAASLCSDMCAFTKAAVSAVSDGFSGEKYLAAEIADKPVSAAKRYIFR